MSKKVLSFSPSNFQYIGIHLRKQKLLEAARSHTLHIYYHMLSSLKSDTEKFGVQDIYQGSTPMKGKWGVEKQD